MVYTKVSIIIPAFNEEATIEAVIERVLAVDINLKKEIIVVNDGSKDKTEENALRVIELHNDKPDVSFKYKRKDNGGKGSAMKFIKQERVLHEIMQTWNYFRKIIRICLNHFFRTQNKGLFMVLEFWGGTLWEKVLFILEVVSLV